MNSKILYLDIETTPNLAFVWRFFKEFVGQDQILQTSEILSFAVKWAGTHEIYYYSRRDIDPTEPFSVNAEKGLLNILNDYLDQADFVVAHNGNKFDIPRIKARSISLGLKPVSPYRIIDTYTIASREFGFQKNSLEHLCIELGIAEKDSHKEFPGFLLWREIMFNNPAAWEEMQKYNIADVVSLEQLYISFRPWMKNHPVIAKDFEEDIVTCPRCGSKDNVRRGYAYTNVGKYRRYKCKSCGGWHKERYSERTKEENKRITVSA